MAILQILMAYWWLVIPLSLTVLIVSLTTLLIQRKQNRRKKYFFANLSAEQCQMLVSADIDYEAANVAGQSGVAVSFMQLHTTLKVLQAQVHATLLESGVVYRVIFSLTPPDERRVLYSISFKGHCLIR